jgi:signal transduction histidine kinase
MIAQQIESVSTLGGAQRTRVEAVVETLARLDNRCESLSEVAHDARNVVTALGLYCELLDEPGVLSPPFAHYGNELKLVATASRRLVEKLVSLDSRFAASTPRIAPGLAASVAPASLLHAPQGRPAHWDLSPSVPIENLAAELLANRNLLAALAGPSVALTVDTDGGARPVQLCGEDFTRILVNLIKNAAEAMPTGGRIHLSLREVWSEPGTTSWLTLNVEDNGPGVPTEAEEKIFEAGYTTRLAPGSAAWSAAHRGLGLSITRSIVEAAGGRIHAANRDPMGVCFQIELPVLIR